MQYGIVIHRYVHAEYFNVGDIILFQSVGSGNSGLNKIGCRVRSLDGRYSGLFAYTDWIKPIPKHIQDSNLFKLVIT